MNYTGQLITESIVVGLMVIIVGLAWGLVLGPYRNSPNWGKYMLVIWLFLIGITVHLICEAVGVNKWYCRKGAACRYS